MKDKIPFTVYTTGIQVATVLASGVHLEAERHTLRSAFIYAAEKLLSPF